MLANIEEWNTIILAICGLLSAIATGLIAMMKSAAERRDVLAVARDLQTEVYRKEQTKKTAEVALVVAETHTAVNSERTAMMGRLQAMQLKMEGMAEIIGHLREQASKGHDQITQAPLAAATLIVETLTGVTKVAAKETVAEITSVIKDSNGKKPA